MDKTKSLYGKVQPEKKKVTKKRLKVFNHDVTVDDEDEKPQSSSLHTAKEDKKKKKTQVEKEKRRRATLTRMDPPAVAPTGANQATQEARIEREVENFVKMITTMGVAGLRTQYAELKPYMPSDLKFEAFMKNPKANRYADVACLEETRVRLTIENPGEIDYIHANWVKLEGHDRNYIAAQAPLEETCVDFWRMCWEHDVFCIVMLCKMVEDGKNKCCQYFPEQAGKFSTFGKMFVNNKRVESEDRFTMFTIELLPEGCSNSKIIKIIQFSSWPDRGVPLSGKTVLRLLRFITKQDSLATGNIVMHCSAGIGRTGTIILIDWVLQKIFKGNPVDFVDLFKKLRNQRVYSIQTEGQYLFIFATILDYIRARFANKFVEETDKFQSDYKAFNACS